MSEWLSGDADRAGERFRLDRRAVASAFATAAADYDRQAVLQSCIAGRLAERLELMRIAPRRILDAGSGTGTGRRLLRARYRRAHTVSIDIALPMVLADRRHDRRPWSRASYVCGDAAALPFADGSFELLYSNLMLQWCNDAEAVLREFRRVLGSDGLLMFSTFGPDTLRELRVCWQEVDARSHVNAFIDMHDLGDALIRCGFAGPVLETEYMTLTYADVRSLAADLKSVGAHNVTAGRNRALTGKDAWARMCAAYERFRRDGRLPATFEVVSGHAWVPAPGTRPQDGSTVAAFPLARLRGSRRGADPAA
jgi:malonyl-CoA O-methyltransferase